MIRGLVYACVAAMFLLHNDLWNWDDPTLVLGLPIGLTYHIAFAVAASGLMILLVKLAWPQHLASDDEEEGA
jgi:hypothetical protein